MNNVFGRNNSQQATNMKHDADDLKQLKNKVEI